MAERVPAPRLLMLLPCALDAPHGNATTAVRLADGLRRRRWEVVLAETGEDHDAAGFDVVLALHAAKAAPQGLRAASAAGKPLVVLFTGTDLNGRPPAAAQQAVAGAAAAVALGVAAARRARTLFDGIEDRLETIRQAVLPLPRGGPLPDGFAPPAEGEERVLVAAGVRTVKDPLRALTALAPLAKRRPGLRLIYAGPELETDCARELRAAIAEHPWASWPGPAPREHLATLMRSARVVLSTSRSEGGPPNTLLEAVQAGVPVVATDIPPHREFPGDPHLFRDDVGLRTRLLVLLDEPSHGAMELRRLQELLRDRHGLAAEAEAWDRVLRRLLR